MSQIPKRVTFDGFQWDLLLPSNIDTEIDKGILWEPVTTKWIREFLRPGMIAVDVGSNIGWFALQMSRCVGPEGKVFAFEPCPGFYRRLLGHLKVNEIQNVMAAQVALSDRVRMCYIAQNVGPYFSSAHLSDDVGDGATHPATCVPLDALCLERCDLIKIDVDGTELEVLQGAVRMLDTFHPRLVVEIAMDAQPEKVLDLLWHFGYRIRPEHKQRFYLRDEIVRCFRAGRPAMNLLCEWKEAKNA